MSEKAVDGVSPSDQAFERQLDFDPASKTYAARCAVCGKVHTLKKTLFMPRYRAFQKLRMQFDFCDACNKWVCEDCFYIDDGNGQVLAICIPCAKERGREGITLAQFDEIRRLKRR